MQSSCQVLQKSKVKHPDEKHLNLAWLWTGCLLSGWLKPTQNITGAISRASVISVKRDVCTEAKGWQKPTSTTATVCSPCCHLTRDTEVSAAAPDDPAAPEVLHVQLPSSMFFVCVMNYNGNLVIRKPAAAAEEQQSAWNSGISQVKRSSTRRRQWWPKKNNKSKKTTKTCTYHYWTTVKNFFACVISLSKASFYKYALQVSLRSVNLHPEMWSNGDDTLRHRPGADTRLWKKARGL